MTDGWAARFVRRWVELYTRGLPADVRDGRREEIDSDLWSQLEEARLIGRSHRSTTGEILVRLLAGVPADVSWRVAHRGGDRARSNLDRDAAPGTHVPALLAMTGGLSFALYGALILAVALTTPNFRIEDVYRDVIPGIFAIVLGGGGIIAIGFATAGLVLQFQERMSPVAAIAGSVGAMGGLFGAFGGALVWLLWLTSAFVVWNLSLAGVLGRRLAAAHIVSAAFLMVAVGLALINTGLVALMVFMFPYSITLVAIGVSINRGVPASEPSRGP